jgi:hypothetical protein
VRIEGDTDANLFFTDATNNRVGIGIITPAEKLDVVGKIKVSDNIVIGTSGKGIDFSATAGTGTSELLADYEEGTWTPTAQTGAYTAASGTYTKIGRAVVLNFSVTFPASGMSGNARLNSIPFNVTESGSGGTTNTASIVIRTVYDTATPTAIRLANDSGTSLTEASLYLQTVSGTLTYFAAT